MSFVPTLSILTALKTAIVAIQLPSSYSAIADYPKAFTAVEVYAQEDLLKAFEDLYLQDDRACFIIPGGDTHESGRDGRHLSSKRETEIHLLFTDRDFNRDQAELVGGAEAPGVVALKDLLIETLHGSTLGIRGVLLVPTSGDPMLLRKTEQETAPGRAAWVQTFTTTAGFMKASIPR